MAIDRYDLVTTHNPISYKIDGLTPFTVGNGEFAFTADVTGLQSFCDSYESKIPLCTQSQWGWHAYSQKGDTAKDFKLKYYNINGKRIGFPLSSEGQEEVYSYLRENPHRANLGRIGMRITLSDGETAKEDDIQNIRQELDLWKGTIISKFTVENIPCTVITCCHPKSDALGVKIDSELIALQRLQITLDFPYGSHNKNASDWGNEQKHRTVLIKETDCNAAFLRQMDNLEYFCDFNFSVEKTVRSEKTHGYRIAPAKQTSELSFSVHFKRNKQIETEELSFENIYRKSAEFWAKFWQEGGAIELKNSSDKRAFELERRIVLSQYLTAVQCTGTLPPQETGLTCNSWYGKFHLEMHWWHCGHLPLWNRLHMFEKSMWWYFSILDKGRQIASDRGYRGVKWPKMVGPEGIESPSPYGPIHIWQQCNPIMYAEVIYKTNPNQYTLNTYKDIVFESAEFLASFVVYDTESDRYTLSAPICPLQEIYDSDKIKNPAAETGYWIYGLSIAQVWRERMGLARSPKWDDVISKMSITAVHDGVYIGCENGFDTYEKYNSNHPSMLLNFGMLPGIKVDKEIMKNTLKKVMETWKWEEAWGWDFPTAAMTAARLGETKAAVDLLMLDAKPNTYLLNGHNWQTDSLPVYLPGNGSLLMAVAFMAAGWDGAPNENAPGFPQNGSWVVRHENLKPLL